jgi:hypothetical protein
MTIDDKLYWTFKYEQSYYGTRLNRRNSINVTERGELFLDEEDGSMTRNPISVNYILNCSSWKQAFLYTFHRLSNNSFIKVNVKNESALIGNGIIAKIDGTVLLDYNKGIVDRRFILGNAPATSLEGTFLKYILPIMASFTARTIQIKDASSLKRDGEKPKLIGKELNNALIECAKNSLELVDL